MYALLALDRREEAVAFMQRLLEALPDASSTYYEAACFYCRLGQPQQALQYLATALEKGFRRFYRIRNADDLAPVRQLPEFEQLMQQYEPEVFSPKACAFAFFSLTLGKISRKRYGNHLC